MDYETIGAAAVGLGMLIAGAFNGWQSVHARREARRARSEASRAANNAHPVSNGWGTRVSSDLSYLRDSMDRAHRRMDEQDRRQNVADERDGDLSRRLSIIAGHSRTAAEQSSAVSAGLAAHLADHARNDARRASA